MTMPDKKDRSAIVPIMILIVVALVLVIVVVPLFDCKACVGVGTTTPGELQRMGALTSDWPKDTVVYSCRFCSGRGSVSLLRNITEEPDELTKMIGPTYKELRIHRESTP